MKLTILETSDMHGYIAPTNFSQREMNLPFGASKVMTVMKEARQKAEGPVLVVENGDYIQGSPLSYFVQRSNDHHVSELMDVLNQIGYDAGLLGNHEFNYGRPYLEEAIQAAHHPVLAANVLNEKGQPAFGSPYQIFEKDGVKIGLLGLLTQYIPHWEKPSHIAGLQFTSALEAAKKYVPQLREMADVVVVAYHGGFERDLTTGEPTEALTGENEGYAILTEVAGIDALLTGHQHREIAGVFHGVPVVQPGFRGSHIGKIELTLARKENGGFRITKSDATLLETGSAAPDQKIIDTIKTLSYQTENWLDQPLGTVRGDMTIADNDAARINGHPYVTFINEVQLAVSGAQISATALFNNEGKGFGKEITMRDVVTNYIYPNTLAVLKVTGAELRSALEFDAAFFTVENGEIAVNPRYLAPKPQYYNYDMYEGITYTINASAPLGQRITALAYKGQDVQDEQVFEVVLNQYRAAGGGDYEMFSQEKIVREIQQDMTEIIAEYLTKHPQIMAHMDHNFQVVK